MRSMCRVVATAFVFLALLQGTASHAGFDVSTKHENTMLGRWTDAADKNCKQPELTFGEKELIYQIDADGMPVVDRLPISSYEMNGGLITVAFSQNHGFAHTKSKSDLVFEVVNQHTVVLQRKTSPWRLVKCSPSR